jgi:hypothetical protein
MRIYHEVTYAAVLPRAVPLSAPLPPAHHPDRAVARTAAVETDGTQGHSTVGTGRRARPVADIRYGSRAHPVRRTRCCRTVDYCIVDCGIAVVVAAPAVESLDGRVHPLPLHCDSYSVVAARRVLQDSQEYNNTIKRYLAVARSVVERVVLVRSSSYLKKISFLWKR